MTSTPAERDAPPRSAQEELEGSSELLDSLREVVFQTDPEGRWTYLNTAWTAMTGFGVAESLGTSFLEYLHPDERESTLAMFAQVISGGADYCLHEGRYRTADGGYCWVELRARVMFGDDGTIVGNTGTLIDISGRRRAEELLAEQTDVLELIAQGAPLHTTLEALRDLIERHTGKTAEISTGDTPYASSSTAAPIVSRIGRQQLGMITLPTWASGELDPAARALIERSQHLAAIAIERQRSEDEIRRQALRDPLTGLANRVLIDDRLQQAVDGALRGGRYGALLLLDLDNFKDVNDNLGHPAGDALLRHVAERLTTTLRATDTAGRLGGDEFAIVLPELSDLAQAERVSRKLLASIQEPVEFDQIRLRTTGSFGISVFPTHGVNRATLFRRADVAMYRAKRQRSGFALFDPATDTERLLVLELAGELRRAVDEHELFLHYQPKIDLRRDCVVGVEALARWEHPERGPIPPDQFIPLAISTGNIKPLTHWVLQKALADRALWSRQGLQLTVAVNLCAELLADPGLPASVHHAMQATHTGAGELEFEITEGALMAHPETAVRTIEQLTELGVAFAIDDFGTGYSSLAYLKRLPVRCLKIDRSFVREIDTDPRDASIVHTTIELAHNLELAVVAEGIETPDACQLVAHLGCDYGQGYFLARPMPSDAIIPWLDNRPPLPSSIKPTGTSHPARRGHTTTLRSETRTV